MLIKKSTRFVVAVVALLVAQIACSLFDRNVDNKLTPEVDTAESTEQLEPENTTESPIDASSINTSPNDLIEFVMQIPGPSEFFVFDPKGRYLYIWDDNKEGNILLSVDIQSKSTDEIIFSDDSISDTGYVNMKISSDGKYVSIASETLSWGEAIIFDTDLMEANKVSLYNFGLNNSSYILSSPSGSGWLPNTHILYIPYYNGSGSIVIYDPFTGKITNTLGLNLHDESYIQWNFDETRVALELREKIIIFDNDFSKVAEFAVPEENRSDGALYWFDKDKLVLVRRSLTENFKYNYYVVDSENGEITSQFQLDNTSELFPNPVNKMMVGQQYDPTTFESYLIIVDENGNVLQRTKYDPSRFQWSRAGDMLAFTDIDRNIQIWKLK